jgi:membrane-bound ClpP family serine protease
MSGAMHSWAAAFSAAGFVLMGLEKFTQGTAAFVLAGVYLFLYSALERKQKREGWE